MSDSPGGDAPLAVLGLAPTAETLYRTLVATGAVQLQNLPELTGLAPAAVRVALDELVERRMAELSEGRAVPHAPQLALNDLVLSREQEVSRARRAVEELALVHLARTGRADEAGVETVRGIHEIRGWVHHLVDRTRESISVFAKPPFRAVGVPASGPEQQLARREVRERVIMERRVLDEPSAEADVLASLDRGQNVRLAETLPSKLIISDESLAVVQLDHGGEDHDLVLVVRPGGLLTCLIALFEREWEVAVALRETAGRRLEPFAAPVDELPDLEDRRVLALLLAGYTDAAVAVRLGVAPRTVQRRVRRLMDQAGTDSRVLLGWHARDRGWL